MGCGVVFTFVELLPICAVLSPHLKWRFIPQPAPGASTRFALTLREQTFLSGSSGSTFGSASGSTLGSSLPPIIMAAADDEEQHTITTTAPTMAPVDIFYIILRDYIPL